jgi:subtilisin-like proprotein convertase family protein
VIVAVVDSGLEIAHEDLEQNVVRDGSWDFNCDDPNPTSSNDKGDHGTSVAGIIAARSDNGIGISGVAGQALLKGFNLISSDQSVLKFLDALGGSSNKPNSADVAIFNQSFGINTISDMPISDPDVQLLKKQYQYGVEKLRSGKGAIYIKAAGNGFKNYIAGNREADCERAERFELSCQNANMEPLHTTPYNIVIGALDAAGKRSSYSTAGSSLWISAPGGESGVNSNYIQERNPNINLNKIPAYLFKLAYLFEPAIVTTDQSGCKNGYSPHDDYNFFQNGTHSLNSDCNYTSTFNGTSSAAPIMSGVVALMLAANSDLSWRGVKDILAKTAEKVDFNHSGVVLELKSDNKTEKYKAELGWITNQATSNNGGYHFHNSYGFGAVDAKAAVEMATNYTDNLGDFIEKDWVNSQKTSLSIPKYRFIDATVDTTTDSTTDIGVTDTIEYTSNLTIEMVQIAVKITHPYTGGLGIKLTSPRGTKSILLNVFNGFDNDDNLDMYLASNAFYGESSQGEWKINVVDISNHKGTLNSWKIKFFGHQ